MGKRCYLAENATIIGDVVMGDDCSVWFGAVLRDCWCTHYAHSEFMVNGLLLGNLLENIYLITP